MLDTLTTLSLPYVLVLFALSAQWLLSVWRHARAGLRPRLAYLAAPGLVALVAAPLLQADPLFGLGAALLLIAAYAGSAYGPAPAQHARQARTWGLAAVVATAAVGVAAAAVQLPVLGWALWCGALLLGLAHLLGAGRAHASTRVNTPGLALRFRPLVSPTWPDLELRIDGDRARLQNIGSTQLYLAGWSASGENGWRRPRDANGQPIVLLPKGATAVLSPWPAGQHGVRVWYVRQTAPDEGLVFRADWTPPGSPHRVLN